MLSLPTSSIKGRCAVLAALAVGSCVVAITLCFVFALLCGSFSSGGWFNRFWVAFAMVAIFLLGTMYVCRDWLADHPERLYLIIALCLTFLFSWSFSVREPGWDVGIHYRNSVCVADLEGEVEESAVDAAIIEATPLLAAQDSSLATVNAQEEALDTTGTQKVGTFRRITGIVSHLVNIEYVPYALALGLCRLVNLSPSHTLLCLRLVGGIFYSVVTYFGMRKLRYGKMLYAAIALLPTSVFLAAELGYSYWLFSLCLYGFATLAGMIQGKVEVNPRTLITMIGVLFLGMLPRVVYFPLMFLCLLIPTSRFEDERVARIYRGALVGAALLAFGLWLVPRLLSGFGNGDKRGGSDVNPSGQIAYILTHPLEFLRTFARFALPPLAMQDGAPDVEGYNLVGGYLSPEASPGLLVNYGYLPRAHWIYTVAVWVVLLWTSLTDKDRNKPYGVACQVVGFVLTFGVFVMIATALYFDFTPVGLREIHGVQRRYLIPMLFPFLEFVFPSRLGLFGGQARVSEARYNASVLLCMTLVILGSMWGSCVSLIV